MALNWRQQRLYLSRIKVYRATRTVGADKEAGDDVWLPVPGLESVPCLLAYTQDDSDPTGVGRVKRRSALTEDRLKVAANVEIRDQDLIVNVTPGDEARGFVHRVMGQPTIRATKGFRKTNERLYQIFQEEKPPAEVVP